MVHVNMSCRLSTGAKAELLQACLAADWFKNRMRGNATRRNGQSALLGGAAALAGGPA